MLRHPFFDLANARFGHICGFLVMHAVSPGERIRMGADRHGRCCLITDRLPSMFSYFENKLYPYPNVPERVPPKGFFPFVWQATSGVRRYLVAMTLLTAAIGAFEALFFAILGRIVDWLSQIPPDQLWEQERTTLLLFAGLLAASPVLVGLQTLFKYQVGGQFSNAVEVEFPPPDAQPEHELLSG